MGELNYRYFLLFLLVNGAFFFYGAYVTGGQMMSLVASRRLFQTMFVNRSTGEEFPPSWTMVLLFILGEQPVLFIICVLAIVMGFAVGGFLCYHLYLLYAGTTTNESFKWSSVDSAHSALVAAHQKYLERKRAGLLPPGPEPSDTQTDTATSPPDTAPTGDSPTPPPHGAPTGEDEFVGCLPPGFSFQVGPSYQKQKVRVIIEQLEAAGAERMPDLVEEDPGPLAGNIYQQGFLHGLR